MRTRDGRGQLTFARRRAPHAAEHESEAPLVASHIRAQPPKTLQSNQLAVQELINRQPQSMDDAPRARDVTGTRCVHGPTDKPCKWALRALSPTAFAACRKSLQSMATGQVVVQLQYGC